eukprot:jgi/Botrbrau1/3366/Bobra.0337s0007.1
MVGLNSFFLTCEDNLCGEWYSKLGCREFFFFVGSHCADIRHQLVKDIKAGGCQEIDSLDLRQFGEEVGEFLRVMALTGECSR